MVVVVRVNSSSVVPATSVNAFQSPPRGLVRDILQDWFTEAALDLEEVWVRHQISYENARRTTTEARRAHLDALTLHDAVDRAGGVAWDADDVDAALAIRPRLTAASDNMLRLYDDLRAASARESAADLAIDIYLREWRSLLFDY